MVVPDMISPVEGSVSHLQLDLAFLVGVTLLGAFTMRGDRRVNRAEGTLLVASYLAFIVLAFWNA